MIYILYWIGIFILGFALCLLVKLQQNEEDLPISKEQIFQLLKILLIISIIFITPSVTFINYKNNQEEKIKINLE
jgi:hypothetical protein